MAKSESGTCANHGRPYVADFFRGRTEWRSQYLPKCCCLQCFHNVQLLEPSCHSTACWVVLLCFRSDWSRFHLSLRRQKRQKHLSKKYFDPSSTTRNQRLIHFLIQTNQAEDFENSTMKERFRCLWLWRGPSVSCTSMSTSFCSSFSAHLGAPYCTSWKWEQYPCTNFQETLEIGRDIFQAFAWSRAMEPRLTLALGQLSRNHFSAHRTWIQLQYKGHRQMSIEESSNRVPWWVCTCLN